MKNSFRSAIHSAFHSIEHFFVYAMCRAIFTRIGDGCSLMIKTLERRIYSLALALASNTPRIDWSAGACAKAVRIGVNKATHLFLTTRESLTRRTGAQRSEPSAPPITHHVPGVERRQPPPSTHPVLNGSAVAFPARGFPSHFRAATLDTDPAWHATIRFRQSLSKAAHAF